MVVFWMTAGVAVAVAVAMVCCMHHYAVETAWKIDIDGVVVLDLVNMLDQTLVLVVGGDVV